MTTRRDFLKTGVGAAAGIVFCGCGMPHRANAQQPARQTLPVTVGGKRVKTIDVHSHCHFHEAGALLGADAPKVQIPPVNGAEEAFIDRRETACCDGLAGRRHGGAVDQPVLVWQGSRSRRARS